MNKYHYYPIILVAIMLSLVGGCNLNSSTNPATTIALSKTPSTIASLGVMGMQWGSKNITLQGTADLPDKTLLRSQLKKDGKPVSWWPSGQDINVASGQWLIMVTAGINGAPQPLPEFVEDSYSLDVWLKDSPGNVSNISIFFPGAPAPAP